MWPMKCACVYLYFLSQNCTFHYIAWSYSWTYTIHEIGLEQFSPHLLHHVSEVYGLCTTDGRSSMVVHELIKGVKFDYPQKILPCTISQHFKMLYTTSKSRQRGRGMMAGRTAYSWIIHTQCSGLLYKPECGLILVTKGISSQGCLYGRC